MTLLPALLPDGLVARLRFAAFSCVCAGFTAACVATLMIHRHGLILEHEASIRLLGEVIGPRLHTLRAAESSGNSELQRLLNHFAFAERFSWVRRSDGRLLLPQAGTPPLRLLAERAEAALNLPLRRDTYRLVRIGDSSYLTHLHLFGPDQSSLWVAEDVTHKLDLLSQLLTWLILLWLACLGLTLLSMSRLTERIIDPIHVLSRLVTEINTESLASSRLVIGPAPREVRELADGYNDLLDRLSQAWQHQREFVSSVSHELRNPLMLVMAQLCRLRGDLGAGQPAQDPDRQLDRQRQAIALAERETGRMRRLIDDLLDLSRGEAGALLLTPERVEVDGLLTEACDLARGNLNRPLRLHLPDEVSDGPVAAMAHADRLQQVVRNLIENADKYSPPDRPIEVELVRLGNGDVRISVKDEGIGIPPAELPRIFERFQRASNAIATGRGSGLGLSVVALLVEAMGGRLGVESELDRGSRFHIDLPPAPGGA
jgi:signal transduction histidine kinase